MLVNKYYFRNESYNAFIGKAIGLPDDFLALKEGSKGGGVIQVLEFSIKSLLSNY